MQSTLQPASVNEELLQRLAELEQQHAAIQAHAAHLASRCETLERELTGRRTSRSWRWTAPLRRVFDTLTGLAGCYRPSALLRDPLVPPDALRIEGGSTYQDYITVGEHFLPHFVQLGGLQPTHRVLEVGAATGRMARPLTRYLRDGGEYCGIDIVRPAIEWAQREFSSRHPNFRFLHANVYNTAYNPAGPVRPSEYIFPFADATFDFAFATSVFTHMYPADIAHYLREIARVLRPGGRCLATFFLLTPEAHAAIDAGRSGHRFLHRGDGFLTTHADLPEAAIALEVEDVRRMCRQAGLEVVEPIHTGSWTGRAKCKTYQDIVVTVKPG